MLELLIAIALGSVVITCCMIAYLQCSQTALLQRALSDILNKMVVGHQLIRADLTQASSSVSLEQLELPSTVQSKLKPNTDILYVPSVKSVYFIGSTRRTMTDGQAIYALYRYHKEEGLHALLDGFEQMNIVTKKLKQSDKTVVKAIRFMVKSIQIIHDTPYTAVLDRGLALVNHHLIKTWVMHVS